MKKLELHEMEMIEGGWDLASCFGAGLGLVGLGIMIATAPATGGLTLGLYAASVAGGFSTGLSIAACVY